ncbi:hypothetical protein [Clostridium putrefaciens]|nr:hypothetical protein [Clostridium putrefaciens]
MLKHIEEEIQRNVIPIRPDRSFERKENKSTQMVNRMNKKELYKNTLICLFGRILIRVSEGLFVIFKIMNLALLIIVTLGKIHGFP